MGDDVAGDSPEIALEGLIRSAVRGESHAAGQLLERVGPLVTAVVRTQVGAALRQRADFDDYLHEVLLEILQRLPTLEPRGEQPFLAWLRRLAVSRVRDHGRLQRHRLGPLESDLGHPLEDAAGFPTAPPHDPARAELIESVAVALQQLPEDQAEMVRLIRMEGTSFRQTADLLSLPLAAVRRGLRQAEARLACLLWRHRKDGKEE